MTDICSNNGCQHGICVPDGLANYHCSCDAGYTGDMCQTSEYSLITIIHLCNYTVIFHGCEMIIKSLDPLRAKKTFIRKKLGHTMVSAIKASPVTL